MNNHCYSDETNTWWCSYCVTGAESLETLIHVGAAPGCRFPSGIERIIRPWFNPAPPPPVSLHSCVTGLIPGEKSTTSTSCRHLHIKSEEKMAEEAVSPGWCFTLLDSVVLASLTLHHMGLWCPAVPLTPRHVTVNRRRGVVMQDQWLELVFQPSGRCPCSGREPVKKSGD